MADSNEISVERVSGSERIASLDVIRGIAILFILFMNIPWMAGYAPMLRDPRMISWTAFDQQAFALNFWLHGTQRGLLELLFGAGIMIMARKAMTPDGPVAVADLHYRRNLLLIVLGFFNAVVLLWGGDILLPYGMAALFLFTFRLWRPSRQLGLGILLIAVSFYSYLDLFQGRAEAKRASQTVAQLAAAHRPIPPELKSEAEGWNKAEIAAKPLAASPEKQKQAAKIRAARTGPLPGYAASEWKDWVDAQYDDRMGFLGEMGEIAGTMLIGMALYQWGIIQGRARRSTYWALLLFGYGIGTALRWSALNELFQFTPDGKQWWLTDDIARLAVTFGHIGLLQLALTSRMGRALLAPFQANGKIPLTTYLGTSLLMMWVLMPSFGFGLWGRWGYGGMMLFAALIIVAECVAANLWLRVYETGPFEWVWKSLAYERRMPFRRRREQLDVPPGLVAAE